MGGLSFLKVTLQWRPLELTAVCMPECRLEQLLKIPLVVSGDVNKISGLM